MPLAELPTRPLPHRVMADLGFDVGVAHPGVVVPGGVVGAYMLKAKPIVMVELEAGFRRAILTPARTARVVACAHRRFWLGRENGIDRLTPHHAQYGWPAEA